MTKAQKIQYSEYEAASMLGITIDRLRELVRDHIVKDSYSTAPEVPTYQPSDLVVLRVLSGLSRQPEVVQL
jgi:hypothetical protein